MKKITGKWGRAALTGGLCGVLNGLFGAGGGIAAVPLLKAGGLEQKKAHATSLAVILPLAVTRKRCPIFPAALWAPAPGRC